VGVFQALLLALVALTSAADGAADDEPTVMELREQCEAGDSTVCLTVARKYRHGLGIPRDPPRADQFYEIGCDQGLEQACSERVEFEQVRPSGRALFYERVPGNPAYRAPIAPDAELPTLQEESSATASTEVAVKQFVRRSFNEEARLERFFIGVLTTLDAYARYHVVQRHTDHRIAEYGRSRGTSGWSSARGSGNPPNGPNGFFSQPHCEPSSRTAFDWRSGNSYSISRDCSNITQVRAFNVRTGSIWRTTIQPDGDMTGTDSEFNLWSYDAQSGFYFSTSGRTCFGRGAARICYD
jgi:hypothetical protein